MKKILLVLVTILSGQVFAAGITSGQTYKIVSAGNKTLTVKNSSLNSGANVVIWTETDVNAQRWTLTVDENNKYQLSNVYSGKILYRNGSVASGASIIQYNQNTQAAGKWDISPVENQEGLFYITQLNQAGTQTLYLEALSTSEGALLQLQSKKEGTEGDRQKWKLELADAKPNYLTAEVRNEMMKKWADYYYRTQTSGSCRNVGNILANGGWWGDAEMFEVVLDAYETTGNPEYETMLKNLYLNFTCRNGSDWMKNDYNDDIAWMVLVSVRAYLMFGGSTYLNSAKSHFDRMYSRALMPSGMLRWKENDSNYPNSTNSCINGPAEVAACYLAIATGDDSYYTKAKNLYALQRQYLYVPSTGQVYDSFVWNGSTPSNYNHWASTYNQGTFLGAAIMLYNRFGEEQYKEDAQKILEYTIKNLCDDNGIIKVCQVATGDLAGFKGILMRYVRRFIVDFDRHEYVDWLQKNAFQAYNNRNSKGISSSAWLTKAPENFIFTDCTNDCNFTNDPFGPSTAVSAAVNTPINRSPSVNAFTKIEAENFDYIKGVHVKAGSDDNTPVLGDVKAGFYTAYYHLLFGNNLAKSIELRVSKARSANAYIEIRLGSPNGALAGTVQIPSEGADWQTISGNLEQPIDGKKNIFLVYGGLSNAGDIMDINYFLFKTDASNVLESYIYPDITDNNGILRSSHEPSAPDKGLYELIDNWLTTKFHTLCKNAQEVVSFTYQSPIPVRLKGYALAAANDAPIKDPKSWKLQASENGADWIDLDVQSNQAFISRYQKKQYDISIGNTYRWFRLQITERNGSANEFQLAEWQLYGIALSDNDITADGGTLTAQYPGTEPDKTLTKLTDKQLATEYQVIGQPDFTIEYQAKAIYRLSGYSITSSAGSSENDPKDWELYGSADGNNWTLIDTRSHQLFSYRNVTQTYPCTIDEGLRYFKLHIKANNGSSATEMAEWQLLGEYYYDYLYNDITSNGGKLTSSQDESANSGNLKALSDNDSGTAYVLSSTVAASTTTPLWIQYESPIPVLLYTYSLTAADDDTKNPRNWVLQGSNDGIEWENVNSRSNVTFSLKGERKNYAVTSTEKKFTHFRLNITRISGGDGKEVKITEWELHGTGLADDAITNNNGTITAEYAGISGNEGIDKLVDNSANSKYNTNFSSSAWIHYTSPVPVKVTAYSITSANDNPGRDPKTWTLEASNDGINWTLIDSRDNQAFACRYATQYYPCSNQADGFTHFRLNITANHGDNLLQIAEWQLLDIEYYETSIKQPENYLEVSIFPNPVNEFLHINMPENGKIQIFNAFGKLVHFQRLEKGISTIRVNDYAQGMYIVTIQSENNIVNRKLIKR